MLHRRTLSLTALLVPLITSVFLTFPSTTASDADIPRGGAGDSGASGPVSPGLPQGETKPCPNCPEPTRQTIYAPTIGLPGVPTGQIVLNCRSSKIIEVTPTFYTAEGAAVAGDAFQMQPAEIRFVEIKSLIPAEHRGRRTWGGMSFSYTGNALEMWAQISLRGAGGADSTDVTFSVLDGRGSDVQEAVWWTPEGGAAVIALGNSSDTTIRTLVQHSDGESRQIDIAPHATAYVARGIGHSPGGVAEAVRLTTAGPAGSLRAVGVVTSQNRKFASSLRFYDPGAAAQPHLFATNLRLKGAAPRMVLKNTGDGEISARPRFRPAAGEGSGVVELPAVGLKPQEVVEVDLHPLTDAAAGRADLDSVSVQVANTGVPGSLVGALYSSDRARGLTYDVPLRDSGPVRNLTGSYPWRVDQDYTTVVSVTNVGDQAARFHVDVRYPGGSYYLAPRELAAGETAAFDLREMLAAGREDNNGRLLPRGLKSGQFHWSVTATPGTPQLIGRAEVVSSSQGVNSSYSCPVCCPDNGPYGGFAGGGSQLFIDGFAARNSSGEYVDCYFNYTLPTSFDMMQMWTGSLSVASNTPTSGNWTKVYGEGYGLTRLYGEYFVTEYQNDGMDCYNNSHWAMAETPVEVVPVRYTFVSQAFGTATFTESFGAYSATLQLPLNSPPCTGTAFLMRANFEKRSGATLFGDFDPRNNVDIESDGQYRVNGWSLENETTANPYFEARLQRIAPAKTNRPIRFRVAGFTSAGTFSVSARVTINCR